MQTNRIIIINEYPIWVKLLHPEYQEYAPRIAGKWVHHNTPANLTKIVNSLRPIIHEGLTLEIKYRPTLNHPKGPFAHLNPPMCVYSTLENKDKLYDILTKKSIGEVYWQSNEDTRLLHEKILREWKDKT